MNKQNRLARLRGLFLLPLLATPLLGLTGCIVDAGDRDRERGRGRVEVEAPRVEVEPIIEVEPEHRR